MTQTSTDSSRSASTPATETLMNPNPTDRRSSPLIARLLGVGLCLTAHAAHWHRPGPAGADVAAGGYRLRGAAGQAETGVAEGGGYRLTGGFWNPLALGLARVPPPAIGQLTLTANSGTPGSSLHARGVVAPAGPVELQAYWEQDGVLRLVGRGQAGADGGFDVPLAVPTDAAAGPARVALLADPDQPEGLADTAFTVTAPVPGRVAGVVRQAAGQGAGAGIPVRLAGPDGLAVGEAVTDAAGGFSFPGLPPGSYQVQVMTGGYPPETVFLLPGQDYEVEVSAFEAHLEPIPAVYLLSAGAVALPGGSLSGNQPVQVGDPSDVPMARLVSLPGKGLAPLQVRFWAEVQRGSLEGWLPLFIRFDLLKNGQQVAPPVITDVPKTVYPDGKLDFPAITADWNSIELPPGKLTLVVSALTVFLVLPLEVGHWEFPVEVVDLGSRWYAGHVKNPQLKVTRQDFFTLRYAFSGALPKLPGVGTPLFTEPMDLGVVEVDNTFDLGVGLKEWMENHGAWDGVATAKAALTLFDVPLLDQQRKYFRKGSSLRQATYQMDPLVKPLAEEICFPIVGPALPKPIDLCGLKFGGSVGVQACFGGQIAVYSDILSDLRLTATVAPGFELALPIGAKLELGPCQATAQIRPTVDISAPLKLDPGHTPPIYWDGLCLELSGKATAALGCCGLGVDKSINLFNPIKTGSCPVHAAGVALMDEGEAAQAAPARQASIAYSPAGFAAAVWENFERTPEGWTRTAPVVSVFDGVSWGPPRPIAGPELAGWEPQIAFLDGDNAAITWVVPNHAGLGSGLQLAGPQPHGLCDIAGKIIDAGCAVIEGTATVVKVLCLGFCGFSSAAVAGPAPAGGFDEVTVVGGGPLWNVRPVLATHPPTRDAVILWLREQEPFPGRQQTLALYFSSLGRDGWSAPERVDPLSNALDLQPALRFDRAGRPAAVWVRDLDGDLDTPGDRTLVFSRLDAGWTPPETLAPLPPAPWTPSLDFDHANQPVVAFVVPATHPRTDELLPADGTLSTLQMARRVGLNWVAQPVGGETRAEAPVLRVTPDNHALILTRAFGGRFGRSGEVASAVASLGDAEPRWTLGPLTADERMNWHVAADLHPTDGAPLLLWEDRDPAAPEAEPEMQSLPASWTVDLAFSEPSLAFAVPHPVPGEPVEVTARVTNLGLKPLRDASFRVDFFDREPHPGATPFASRTVSGALGFGEELAVTAPYTPPDRAWRTFHVVVDAAALVAESDEINNRAATAWGGLAAPEDFNAAPVEENGSMRLQWTPAVADGSVRHWLWRTHVRTGETELLGATVAGEFTDTTVTPGEDYLYRMVVADARDVRSTVTATGAVTVPAVTPDPALLRLNFIAFGGVLTLTWTGLPAVQLEATDELAGARTVWQPVTDGIHRFGGVAQISLPAVQGLRFFRLMQP